MCKCPRDVPNSVGLKLGHLVKVQFDRATALADLGRRFDVLAHGREEPTAEQLDTLSAEWRKAQSAPAA